MYSQSAKITEVLPDSGTEFGGELHSIQTSGMASLLGLPEARKDSIQCLFGDVQARDADANGATQAITVRPAPQAWTNTNVSVACSMDGGQHYLATSAEYMLLPCSVGTVSSAAENPCLPCAAGQYAGRQNQSVCQACPLGYHASAPGAAACDACPKGKLVDGSGFNECEQCAQGRYSSTTGSSSCNACEKGTASNAPSVSTCSGCTPGRFTRIEGSTECDSCPLGEFNSQTGRSVCEQCSLGLCPTQHTILGIYEYYICCRHGEHFCWKVSVHSMCSWYICR